MKKIILFFILMVNLAYSQKQNNIWYFGNNTGLDFNHTPPLKLNNSKILTVEGSASISDSLGNLLFYTNGIQVWNAQHEQMANGFGLLGGNSSTQSALIIPKPLDCNKYFIFTVPEETDLVPLSYSIVDMTLNGGLGNITSKNIPLHMPVTERLTGTIKANGIDYWVVAQTFDSKNFIVYSVTSAGIDTVPVISHVGVGAQVHDIMDVLGYMKISPDGSKLSFVSLYGNIPAQLFDFNNTNGIVSNPISLPNYNSYGVEFSPDSKKLYISTANSPFIIKQYNLEAGNSSIDIINTNHDGGALQLGPDNKIYSDHLSSSFIGVINYPDSIGTKCNYIDNAIPLGWYTQDGLPNLIKQYSSCSSTTTNISKLKAENFIFFPNPTSGKTEIMFNQPMNNISIKVFNLTGQKIFEKTNMSGNIFNIDITNQTAGVYFIEILSENNVLKRKLIKE